MESALAPLIEETNLAVSEIAEDNHLSIHLIWNKVDRGYYQLGLPPENQDKTVKPFVVGIAHNAGISYAEDSFALCTLFCTMVGLCLGVYLALCQEAKKQANTGVIRGDKL